MVVEASKGYSKGPARKTKIFIGNIHKDTKVEELRSLFAEYGEVVESDILNHYGFIVSLFLFCNYSVFLFCSKKVFPVIYNSYL